MSIQPNGKLKLSDNRAEKIIAVLKDKEKRQDACKKELEQLLLKHNCTISPSLLIEPGKQIQGAINIIANENK